ncbi:ANTAR domain-containing protein [Aeromicrobium sp. 9AM]|uniref:ANTAR domain-containing protein n=1 Tax=Aeromicrobium sp. 9AM TaxID=2653126 RepID=UPI0012F3159E|nr:ANTAR domain-containing protein [Aeromicrobium sp. 9AM]VXB52364.1 conserved hypothetical protein [Aeromicrobium sp. 9AM]
MVKKRRRLPYEEPVMKDKQNAPVGGLAGQRLRSRIAKSTGIGRRAESQALIEQATGFLAEKRHLSIADAREVLAHDADTRGITMHEAATRVLNGED